MKHTDGSEALAPDILDDEDEELLDDTMDLADFNEEVI